MGKPIEKPNKQTIEAMEELKSGKGVRFDSVDGLFETAKTLQEKEDLGLLLLMQQSDRNDTINRDEIMKELE